MGEEPAEIKRNLVNLGGSQEGEQRVGTGLTRKADSGSYKQNPTSPEKIRTCQHSHNLNSDSASHLQISCQSRNRLLVVGLVFFF